MILLDADTLQAEVKHVIFAFNAPEDIAVTVDTTGRYPALTLTYRGAAVEVAKIPPMSKREDLHTVLEFALDKLAEIYVYKRCHEIAAALPRWVVWTAETFRLRRPLLWWMERRVKADLAR